MDFSLNGLVSEELRGKADNAVHSALEKLGKGMRDFLEDEKTFNEVVDLAYEALPLPVRLGLRKDIFRKFVMSLKANYMADRPSNEEIMKAAITKMEQPVTILPREIDEHLATALGHLVVAFGRLEHMFNIAIKRILRRPRSHSGV